MALVCLKCTSADCTCGRLAGLAAELALIETAAGIAIGSDLEPDDISIELASLLLARQRERIRMRVDGAWRPTR